MAGVDDWVELRPMHAGDAEAVARLSGELGYPATAEQMAVRFEAMRRSSATQPAEVIVAIDEGSGEVVGWLHVAVPAMLAIDAEPDIWGLVVASSHRGRGIGARLMAAAEAWALEHGYAAVWLRSNQRRVDAHRFYKRLGYEIVKSQFTFSRSLSPVTPASPPQPQRPAEDSAAL